MIRNQTSELIVNEKLTNRWEIQQKQAANPNLSWEEASWTEVPVGTLNCIDALYPDNNLKKLIIENGLSKICEIRDCDVNALPLSKLQKLKNATNNMDHHLAHCRVRVDMARTFLRHDNLKKVNLLFNSHTHLEKSDFEKYSTFLTNLYRGN